MQTCSKRKLTDTVPEESCTKRKSQSSVQKYPKVDHTCLKCQRILQTSQHKDYQSEEERSLRRKYCITCVSSGILIPNQPIVDKDMEEIGKTNNDKSHVTSEDTEVRDQMAGVSDDLVIFESTDVVTSDNSVASAATKMASTLGNYAKSKNSHVAYEAMSDNHVTSEESHVASPSNLPMSAGKATVNATCTFYSSLPMLAKSGKACKGVNSFKCLIPIPVTADSSGRFVLERDALIAAAKSVQSGKTMTNAVSALPSKLLLSTGKTTINARGFCTLPPASTFTLPMTAGNDTVNTTGAVPASLPVSAENPTVNIVGPLPSNLPTSTGNTSMNTTATSPSTLLAAANNTKVTVRGAQSSRLHVKGGKSAKSAAGALSSCVLVGGKTTKVSAGGSQTSKPANSSCRLPSSLHEPAGGTKKNATWASLSGLSGSSTVSKSKPTVNAIGSLASNVSTSAGNILMHATGVLPSSLPLPGGNTAVTATGTLPSSLPVSAGNPTVNAVGSSPSDLPMSAGNTTVNATSIMPSTLLAAGNNAKVTVRGAQSSRLHVKGGKSEKSAAGALPSCVLEGGKTTKVSAGGSQTSKPVNSSCKLPSSFHGPAGGTKKNTTWASPSGLSVISKVSKSKPSKEQHVSYAKATLQCLNSLKLVKAHILKSKLSQLHTLFLHNIVNADCIIVSSMKQVRAELDPAFEADMEQDPHDFLIKIIKKYRLGNFFQTDLTTKYMCPSWKCRHRWEKTHTGNSITLPKPQRSSTTLAELMSYQKSDSISCPKCGSSGVLKQTVPTSVRKYLILRIPPYYTLCANRDVYYPLKIVDYCTKYVVLGRYGFKTKAVIKLNYTCNHVEYSALVHECEDEWKEHMSDDSVMHRRTLGFHIKGAYLVFLKLIT